MIVRLIAAALVMLSATSCSQRRGATAVVRVETLPEGATITLDGHPPRVAPALFEGLAPGLYTFTSRLDGYREARQSVFVAAGQNTGITLRLEPLYGFVLIRSAPDGAEVEMDGISRGKTPLLLPECPLGTHKIRLQKAGFSPKTLEITVRDRSPLLVETELESRLVRLQVESQPSEAAVVLNGTPRGTTPCTLEMEASGEWRLEIRKDGFAPYVETLTPTPGRTLLIRAPLVPLPAELVVETTPPGAKVFLDGTLRGETPLTLPDVPQGEHRLRIELRGYEPVERPITLTRAGRYRETFSLVRNSGVLVIITTPAEAEVFLDGERVGTTPPSAAGGEASEPLRVDYLSQGPHTLQLVRRGWTHTPRTITIEANQVLQIHEKMTRVFLRDTLLIVRRGEGRVELTGQLLRRLPNGDVEFALNPGVVQIFEAASIIEIRPFKANTP